MRVISLLALLFFVSCQGPRIYNKRMKKEIISYNLETIDTFVDIACGYARYDKIISNQYPNLHLILEDLSSADWNNDLKKYLINYVQNSPSAPKFKTNTRLVFGTPDSIPLKSEKYERVLCRISLHEFTKREKMISELVRILSPTGTLIIVKKFLLTKGRRKSIVANYI